MVAMPSLTASTWSGKNKLSFEFSEVKTTIWGCLVSAKTNRWTVRGGYNIIHGILQQVWQHEDMDPNIFSKYIKFIFLHLKELVYLLKAKIITCLVD